MKLTANAAKQGPALSSSVMAKTCMKISKIRQIWFPSLEYGDMHCDSSNSLLKMETIIQLLLINNIYSFSYYLTTIILQSQIRAIIIIHGLGSIAATYQDHLSPPSVRLFQNLHESQGCQAHLDTPGNYCRCLRLMGPRSRTGCSQSPPHLHTTWDRPGSRNPSTSKSERQE